MTHSKTSARITGALFLLPLLAYGTGGYLIASLISRYEDLASIAAARQQLMTGALLLLLNSITVVVIAIRLYPVLKAQNQQIGLYYLCARIMEALILILGLMSLLQLFTVGDGAGKTNLADPYSTDLLYRMAMQSHDDAYQLAMIVLGIGSMPFCYLLLRSGLIPTPLAWMGLLGYALLALGSCFELFGYNYGTMLSLPGGLFEVGLAIWLMAKGWRPNT